MQSFISHFAPFIFGLFIGSFLNCVIYRLEVEKSFLKGRSFCPNCKHQLFWIDLIPVVSFLILGGKCRYCKKSISWQYPLVEIATGIIFVLIFQFLKLDFYLNSGIWLLNFIYYIVIFSLLVIIFVFDLKHYIIPDEIVFTGIGLSFLYQVFQIWNFGQWDSSKIIVLGYGLLPALFLLGIILFSKGKWMGLGDFKLAILMGLFLKLSNLLVALFLAFFIGAIIGVALIFLKNKALKSEIPFGPFLVFGTFVALFWGEKLISFYFSLFI